ncbi:hypothetical protein NQ314_002907 [Rhamnusium bicolor]|uniref:Resistance to inhibitors of cholinesterase protein 3 N-terminal domain-containing protein n=1 Tax=Rhamnusium bicolor TaxID=1586634 RepID=A0AAV8ZRS4_9CUCU|nr:hypothetical protein NQ314_002907 [Rhamnusium bicolor]
MTNKYYEVIFPGPIPAMRPTLGGAGHVVPPPKQGTGSMGLIMPIYTVGIVIFFTYTVMKKQPEALYPPVEPDPNFRKEVFESERTQVGPKLTREGVSRDAELDQLRRRLRETELAMERIVEQMAKVPLKLQVRCRFKPLLIRTIGSLALLRPLHVS